MIILFLQNGIMILFFESEIKDIITDENIFRDRKSLC